jgi:endoglucanase
LSTLQTTFALVYPTAINARVNAVNEYGNGATSTTGTWVNTPAFPPSTPTNLRLSSNTDTSITVTWDAITDRGGAQLSSYTVTAVNQANPGVAATTVTVTRAANLANFNARLATVNVLSCTQYSITVTATNEGSQTSAASNAVVLTGTCNNVPSAPQSVVVDSRTTGQLVVSF